MKLSKQFLALRPCQEAKNWLSNYPGTMQGAWLSCSNPCWLFWFIGAAQGRKKLRSIRRFLRCFLECASFALPAINKPALRGAFNQLCYAACASPKSRSGAIDRIRKALDKPQYGEAFQANECFAQALLAVCDTVAPAYDVKFADPKFVMGNACFWLLSTFITAHVFKFEATARLCKVIRRHYPTLPRMPKLTRQ